MHYMYELFGYGWYDLYRTPSRWSPPLFDRRGRVIPRRPENPRAR